VMLLQPISTTGSFFNNNNPEVSVSNNNNSKDNNNNKSGSTDVTDGGRIKHGFILTHLRARELITPTMSRSPSQRQPKPTAPYSYSWYESKKVTLTPFDTGEVRTGTESTSETREVGLGIVSDEDDSDQMSLEDNNEDDDNELEDENDEDEDEDEEEYSGQDSDGNIIQSSFITEAVHDESRSFRPFRPSLNEAEVEIETAQDMSSKSASPLNEDNDTNHDAVQILAHEMSSSSSSTISVTDFIRQRHTIRTLPPPLINIQNNSSLNMTNLESFLNHSQSIIRPRPSTAMTMSNSSSSIPSLQTSTTNSTSNSPRRNMYPNALSFIPAKRRSSSPASATQLQHRFSPKKISSSVDMYDPLSTNLHDVSRIQRSMASKVPSLLKERIYDTTGLDKIFASIWVNERDVVRIIQLFMKKDVYQYVSEFLQLTGHWYEMLWADCSRYSHWPQNRITERH
jgi:hypothetical protein